MKIVYLFVAALFIVFITGCVQQEKSTDMESLPECEFPKQIGAYQTGVMGDFPMVYQPGLHDYGDSIYVLAPYGLASVKALLFGGEYAALNYFENSNYYSETDCEIFDKKADCLVESGKSSNDRFCVISDTGGRCVHLYDTAKRSWKAEFEWFEGTQVKNVAMTGTADVSREKKFSFLEPFVEQFKECTVKVD